MAILFAVLWLLLAPILAMNCVNLTIPVNINARQGRFELDPINDNWSTTKFSLNFTSTANGGNFTDTALVGYQTVRGRYNISATYCTPSRKLLGPKHLQILIHGIGFDKSYWHLPFNNYNYSYTRVAVDTFGFYTLAIDRFGIAESSHADALNIVQAPATLSSIYQITQMARESRLPGCNDSFKTIVHVGHSFGSFLSYLLAVQHPDASDGLVLTGFSFSGDWLARTVAAWNLHLASFNQPLRFGNVRLSSLRSGWTLPRLEPAKPPATPSLLESLYGFVKTLEAAVRSGGGAWSGLVQCIYDVLVLFLPRSNVSEQLVYADIATTEVSDIFTGYNSSCNSSSSLVPQNLPDGYMTWSDVTANIYAFLYPPYFDPAFALVGEATKQPVTTGELLTIGIAPDTAPQFKGPVLVFTGRQDNIYCGGDCLATEQPLASIPAQGRSAFPNAKDFEAYIQPNTGHGINFHYNATSGYIFIQLWLTDHDL